MKEFMYLIKNAPLFDDMSLGEIEAALDFMNGKISDFRKNEYIFRAGEKAVYTGILLQGQGQIVRDDFFGNRAVISKINSGDMFGEVFACGEIEILPVSVISLSDGKALFFDYKKIIAHKGSDIFHSKLVKNMLKILAGKSLNLNEKIEALSAKTTREKIMVYLLAYASKSGGKDFEIPFNRQQLAEYLCVERSAMSAELGRMKKEGLIDFHKNHFILP